MAIERALYAMFLYSDLFHPLQYSLAISGFIHGVFDSSTWKRLNINNNSRSIPGWLIFTINLGKLPEEVHVVSHPRIQKQS